MNGSVLRIFAVLVSIICASALFVACAPIDAVKDFFADDGTGHIFKIAIDSTPENLDPQLASDANSIAVAKNLFAGLMRYDENGRLVGWLAEDYTISGDGLTYTFKLKDGYKWHSLEDFEAPVTAHDFVFGFQRLMDPKIASPHSADYYCISGSRAARAGTADIKDIGVRAVDDYTLEFTLEYQNAEFLNLLAELPAMPCCREFYETSGGKYGLEAENTCSNGPFYIRYWLHDPYGKDNYIRLRRNPGYSEMSYVSPAGINYLITKSVDERRTDFAESAVDAIIYPAGSYAPTDSDSSVYGYSTIAGLIFNEKIEAFSSPDVRQIFSWALDRDALNQNAPDILLDSRRLIPDDRRISARGYASKTDDEVTAPNSAMAKYKWSFILSDGDKSELIGKTVMVPSWLEYSDLLRDLTDSWYSALNIHFSIDIVNADDYNERLSKGDYDIALVTLSSQAASPIDYIRPFAGGKYGISLESARSAVSEEGRYSSLSTLNYRCAEAEDEILSQYHFIPVWQLPTVLCFDEDAEGITLDPFSGTAYFENAKMF